MVDGTENTESVVTFWDEGVRQVARSCKGKVLVQNWTQKKLNFTITGVRRQRQCWWWRRWNVNNVLFAHINWSICKPKNTKERFIIHYRRHSTFFFFWPHLFYYLFFSKFSLVALLLYLFPFFFLFHCYELFFYVY